MIVECLIDLGIVFSSLALGFTVAMCVMNYLETRTSVPKESPMSETRLQITDCQGKHLGYADGECENCETLYSAVHECQCGEHGGDGDPAYADDQPTIRQQHQESLGLPLGVAPMPALGQHALLLAALASLGITPPEPAKSRKPRFTWLKPVLSRILKNLPGATLWSAMLATVFAGQLRTMPNDNPLAAIVDLPFLDEAPWSYILSGCVVLIFAVWAVFIGRPKVETKL